MLGRRRLRLFLTLSLSGLILAYWGFRGDNIQPEAVTRDTSNDIDGFLVQSETLQFDEQGLPQHRLIANRIDHYPELDISRLDTPKVRVFGTDGPDVIAEAEKGEIGPDNQVVILTDKVEVIEQIDNGYRMNTDFLRIEPDNDYAETHAPVTLLQANTRVDAIGMQVYMDTNRILLLEDVRGHHEPK